MGSVGRATRAGGLSTEEELTRDLETAEVDEEKLQKFRGNAINGGWEFEGNEWTEDWFRKNSDSYELVEQMSAGEREAFRAYTRGAFMRGQMYRDWDDIDGIDQARMRIYDKYMDQAELKQGIVVYRRSTFELINEGKTRKLSVDAINARAGEIIPCKSVLSAAAAREGLSGMGSGSKPVEYEIKVPSGRGSGMWIGQDKINGWGPRQREYALNRDANYRLDGARYDAKRGVTIVTITYLGHDKHRYS